MFGFRPLYRKEKFETFQIFKLHTSEKSTKTRITRYVFETHKMVSFNIARTTYILSGQKLIKKAKNFDEFLKRF